MAPHGQSAHDGFLPDPIGLDLSDECKRKLLVQCDQSWSRGCFEELLTVGHLHT